VYLLPLCSNHITPLPFSSHLLLSMCDVERQSINQGEI